MSNGIKIFLAATLGLVVGAVFSAVLTMGQRSAQIAELAELRPKVETLQLAVAAERARSIELATSNETIKGDNQLKADAVVELQGKIQERDALISSMGQTVRDARQAVENATAVQRDLAKTKEQRPPREDRAHLDQEPSPASVSDEIESAVRAYVEAKTIKERFAASYLGRVPEKRFYRWFQRGPFSPATVDTMRQISDESVEVSGTWGKGNYFNVTYYLHEYDNGRIIVDWARTAGFNHPPLSTFIVTRPREPDQYWVWASLSDYYNYDFEDRERWVPIDVDDRVDTVTCTAYYPRAIAQDLVEYLTEPNAITLLLSYPHDMDSRGQLILLAWKPGYSYFSGEEIKAALQRDNTGPFD